jgi:hypothetical protein
MLSVLMIAPLLGACPKENSEVAVKIICPEISKYDKATQDRALAEYKALPEGSAIKLMIGDYKHLRDKIRACGARK